ncbi:MAG: type II secretion system F family protein [Pirellulales bacterium]|nr:type II secretion system F family protein [Pirellulales bacterium]
MTESQGRPTPRPNPFPENELPKWLFRKSLVYGRQTLLATRPPPYKVLADFAYNLGSCVRGSADLPRGLELCIKPLRKTAIGKRWSGAAEAIRGGATLTDALAPARDLLPPFFLPVIQAGEQSGRLDDALHFLQTHCNLISGPVKAVRNLWMVPLVIMVFGSVLRVLLVLVFGTVGAAFSMLGHELFSWLQVAVVVAIALLTPAKYFIDQARLSLPVIGPFEREISLHRFFRILALVYAVGGQRVEEMIRMAAKTVSNHAARLQLQRAATAIEDGATITEALGRVEMLSEGERTSIEVGEMSGKLETIFEQISDDAGAAVVAKVKVVEPLLVRLVSFFVIVSICYTLISLISVAFL